MNETRIFALALQRGDAAERAAFLAQACGGDDALRQRVEARLHAHDACAGLPAATADFATAAEPATLPPPSPPVAAEAETLPHAATPANYSAATGQSLLASKYRLLQILGEGGMGTVFLAEQIEPMQRRVAVKLIKLGMDSAQVIARFDAERQALAVMDHPHIAKVHDAGVDAGGQPFFVMELVPGVPLTRFCDEARLTVRQRLELFVPICQAVQHAHQKGVIHRDLKPSNILADFSDGKPVPKIIDFGIAKATGAKLTEQTVQTQLGAVVGTLEYMSPEQAGGGQDIDTRSDIYSLGAILYELLTGTTPLGSSRQTGAVLLDVLIRICEEEPPRPSVRVGTLEAAAHLAVLRQSEPARLAKLLRGDLDWIVMKALEKDRARRYETANDLALDVQRYLADEPVSAGPPSTSYRLRKFVKRNRGTVAAASLLLLALLSGVMGTSLGLLEARRQRDAAAEQRDRAVKAEAEATANATRAKREGARAKAGEEKAKAEEFKAKQSEAEQRAVLQFFHKQVLAAARPKGQEGGLGVDATIRAAVDAAEPKIAQAFRNQPLVEASIRAVLGNTYGYLGEALLAIRQHERALALRESKLGADHPHTLSSRNNLAEAYLSVGRIAEAIRLHEQNLKQRQAKFGPDHPSTLSSRHNLASAYRVAGRTADAILLHEQNLQLREVKLGPRHPDTLLSRNGLANAYGDAGRIDEAIPLLQQNLRLREALLGPGHPDTLSSRNNLANAYRDAGRIDDAIGLHEQNLRQSEAELGPDHLHTLQMMANLGITYQDAGRPKDAIPLLEAALRRGRRRRGGLPARLAGLPGALAQVYDRTGQFAKAEAHYRDFLAQGRKQFGPDDPRTAGAMAQLGGNLLKQKKFADAEDVLRQCLTIRDKKQPNLWTTYNTRSALGEALAGQKKYADAEPLLLQGYEGMKKRQNNIPPPYRKLRLTEARQRLVQLYDAWDKKDQADHWRKQSDSSAQK